VSSSEQIAMFLCTNDHGVNRWATCLLLQYRKSKIWRNIFEEFIVVIDEATLYSEGQNKINPSCYEGIPLKN
jgi:hypothetical protein